MADRRNSGKPMSRKAARAKRRKRKIIIVAVELILLLIVLLGLYVMLKLSKIDEDKEFSKANVKNEDLTEETKDVLGNYDTIALFGLDNREDGTYNSGNSDVIMLARIDKETKEVKLVSVYRDTYLKMMDEDKENAYSKANAAYNMGGPEQAVRMLNANLDLDIKEYVSFDFKAVAEAVDLLGGVEIEISDEEAILMQGYQDDFEGIYDMPIEYLNQGGTYNLNGIQAVAYARIRYVGNGDFKRTERQRLVLSKMVEKALQSDLGTIDALIDTVFGDIRTSLTKAEMLNLAKSAFSYRLGETTGFPLEQEGEKVNVSYQSKKASCIIPADLALNVKLLHEFLYDVTDYEVSEGVKNISDTIIENTGVQAHEIEPEDSGAEGSGSEDSQTDAE